jgi:hypothetical protein
VRVPNTYIRMTKWLWGEAKFKLALEVLHTNLFIAPTFCIDLDIEPVHQEFSLQRVEFEKFYILPTRKQSTRKSSAQRVLLSSSSYILTIEGTNGMERVMYCGYLYKQLRRKVSREH